LKPFHHLEETLQYTFQNSELLQEALTHSSYANEKNATRLQHNERLEFLGDSVLSLVVSDYLFHRFPNLPEGELTKVRAAVVCEPTLAEHAQKWQLGEYISFGRGEAQTGGRKRPSILADAFEAVVAAVYLDGGFIKAQRLVLTTLEHAIQDAVGGKIFTDYKTALQEWVQARQQQKISYEIVDAKGPDHKKSFSFYVFLDERSMGQGEGRSKKEAEQAAAKMALSALMAKRSDAKVQNDSKGFK